MLGAAPPAPSNHKEEHTMHYYYVVRPGDTLSGIAYRFTGRANNYWALAAYNGIRNPNYIYPGEVIWLS